MNPNIPFYIKAPVIMLGLVITVFILFILRDVLVPLAFAAFIAILLNPLSNRFERKLPKVISITLTMLIALIILAGLLYFLSTQVAHFFDDVDAIRAKLNHLQHDVQNWVEQRFGMSTTKQDQMVKEAANNSRAIVGQTLNGLLGILSVVF